MKNCNNKHNLKIFKANKLINFKDLKKNRM